MDLTILNDISHTSTNVLVATVDQSIMVHQITAVGWQEGATFEYAPHARQMFSTRTLLMELSLFT